MTENNEYKPVPFTEEEYAEILRIAKEMLNLFLKSQDGKRIGQAIQVLDATLTFITVETVLFMGLDKKECINFFFDLNTTCIKALDVWEKNKNSNKSNDKSH